MNRPIEEGVEDRVDASEAGIEVIGGVEHRAIAIVDPDPGWPERFAAERRRIVGALGPNVRVEHVGSTAVPGLAAKPIVDVQVAVVAPDDEWTYVPDLEAIGYVLRAREAGHRLLRTPQRDVHVHVCGIGSDWERRHLLFRDWLRVDAADRSAYEATKRELALRDWPTMQHYALAKSDIIERITAHAEAWAARTGWRVPD